MTNSGFSHKITALALIGALGLPPSSAYAQHSQALRQTNVRDNAGLEDELAAGLESNSEKPTSSKPDQKQEARRLF